MYRCLLLPIIFILATVSSGEPACVAHVESLEYPRLALFAKIQGEVAVAIEIGSDGRVESAAGISGPPMLVPAAEENIRKWRFQAGLDQKISIKYRFTLE